MKAFRSIRWRLQFWYALLLGAALLGFSISVYEIERGDLVRSADAELLRRVGGLTRALRVPPPPLRGADSRRPPGGPPPEGRNGPPSADALEKPGPGSRDADLHPDSSAPLGTNLPIPPQDAASYESGGSGDWYYAIWLREGRNVIRSPGAPPDIPEPARPDLRAPDPVLRTRGDLREACAFAGRGVLVLVGHSTVADLQRLHRIAWLTASAAGMILALGLLGGRWLVGLSLRPIADISAAASKIAGGNLSERVAVQDTDSELGELAAVLNATFARLEAAFTQQARFTADAAHELRTPLSVLLTHTQNALAIRCPCEDHHEALEACQRAAQRMRALTESLLWLARLESGAQALKKVRFDLAERVSECAALVRPLAEKRRIALHAELIPAACVGDPGQIDQVVTNLLTNAIDHSIEGGEVRVSTEVVPGCVRLVVADNGSGIAPDDLPHVFERFYRADKSRSRISGGTGLGLAITKAIVEAHAGSIGVTSEPGQGARFTASFPA